MKRMLVLFLALGLNSLTAQTVITDKQEVSGTWTKKGSPYYVMGEAIVPKGKTLKIKPGVEVQFKTGTNREYSSSSFDLGFLRVNGTLIAKGSKKEFIRFTRKGREGNWGNLVFTSGSSVNKLSYCIVEHSYYVRSVTEDDNATGGLSFIASYAEVDNCLLVNNGWTGVNCKQTSKPLFRHCVIARNEYGVECNSASTPDFVNCIIWANENAFYTNGKSHPRFAYCLIQESTLDEDFIDGGNNIYKLTPGFYDPAGGNYWVSKSSPAYGKGLKGANIGLK